MTNINGRKRFATAAPALAGAIVFAAIAATPASADHVIGHDGFDDEHFNQGYIGDDLTSPGPVQGDFSARSGDGEPRRGCGIGLGTLAGAALGGFIGSQFGSGTGQLAATGAGVFLGGAIGNRADCPR